MPNLSQLNNRLLFLGIPKHDETHLPVPASSAQSPASLSTRAMRLIRSIAERKENMRIVFEFRDKLRTAEELISKLAYSLREIQGAGLARSEKLQRGLSNLRRPWASSAER